MCSGSSEPGRWMGGEKPACRPGPWTTYPHECASGHPAAADILPEVPPSGSFSRSMTVSWLAMGALHSHPPALFSPSTPLKSISLLTVQGFLVNVCACASFAPSLCFLGVSRTAVLCPRFLPVNRLSAAVEQGAVRAAAGGSTLRRPGAAPLS